MATQDEILRANEAEMILKSETFKQAIKSLKEEYISLWTNSQTDEESLREKIHIAVKLLPEIEKHLRIVVEKGTISKANINRIRKIV